MFLRARIPESLSTSFAGHSSITFRLLTIKFVRQGLSHILDNVGEYYNTTGLSTSRDKTSLHSGFVSPATISLPVAKIIPLLSSQVRRDLSDLSESRLPVKVLVTGGEQDVWLLYLQENPSIKVLGANVYESFCQPALAKTEPEESWTDWMASTVSQWL